MTLRLRSRLVRALLSGALLPGALLPGALLPGALLPCLVTAGALLGGGCLGRTEPPPEPGPVRVTSGLTVVEVDRATGVIRVLEDRPGAEPREVGSVAGAGCAPVALAIRPPDDDGNQYHDVEAPGPDLEWYRPVVTTVLAAAENTAEIAVALGRDGTEVRYQATVRIEPGAEGFVDVNISVDAPVRAVAMVETCLPLGANAHAVGGGERFDGVDLVGRVIPLAFRAPGPFASSTNESHAPVPFIATAQGLGLLVETERVGAFDVGAADAQRLIARFHGGELPLRLRAGDIIDNVAAHNRRMGLPPAPPVWALAPQQWRNEHEVTVEGGEVVSDGRERFLDDAQAMRALELPDTAMWIDAPWASGYNTFAFNDLQFPDAPSMLSAAEELGYRVIVWSTEYLNRSDDSDQQPGMPAFGSLGLFYSFDQAGFLVRNSDGSPFVFSWARGQGGFVDFSNPAAVVAWQDLMRPLLEAGVRGFKLDYGETMRADLLGTFENTVPEFHDGSTTAVMHTRYARLYHEAFLGVLEEVHPGDHFIITRTGGIHDQKNGVALWPGDLDNDFSRAGDPTDEGPAVGGLPAAVSAGLSASMSGYPLYGSDIGGYRGGAPTTEVLLRWAQFGAVSTIMQLGGGGTGDTTHNPWDERYDPAVAVPIYRRYARLHMDLVPYLTVLLDRAATTGDPPLIALGAAFPDDEEAWNDPDAFLFGPALAAYPVVEAGADTRDVRLPAGTWLDWWNGDQHEGPKTFTRDAPLDTLPLFQRAGAVIPMSDPRLDTYVAATDDDVFDVDDERRLHWVRTSAGPDERVELPDGSTAAQTTVGRGVTVEATAPEPRLWVFEVLLRDDMLGPWAAAPIRTDVGTTVAAPTLELFLQCLAPCVYRGEDRLYAKMAGAEAVVTFGDLP